MAQAMCSQTFSTACLSSVRLASQKFPRCNAAGGFAPSFKKLTIKATSQEREAPEEKPQHHDQLAQSVAATVFSALAAAPSASAAELVAELAADTRGLSILALLVPALGWVLFNIFRPALNQIDNMRGGKAARSAVAAVGASAAAAAGANLFLCSDADAAELVAQVADSDNRPLLLLLILVAALGWVGFNILIPALNQISNMTKKKGLIGAIGLGGALALAESADAAELSSVIADNRPLALLVVLGPALGWVLFQIFKPAMNQIASMTGSPATSTKKVGRK